MTLSYLATVWLLITLNFALPRAMPGDPILAMTASAVRAGAEGPLGDASTQAALRHYYGLDRSLASQYGQYLGDLTHGDLGVSIRSRGVPVSTLLAQRLPWTLLLVGLSTVIATLVGAAAGLRAGWRADRRRSTSLVTAFVAVREIPTFLLATAALLVFAVALQWAPLGGATDSFSDASGFLSRARDIAGHLLLPASVLVAQMCASTFLVMRAGVVSELGSDYLLLGRAKGLAERRLEYAYAGRNALLPVVTLTTLQLGAAVSGAIFVEQVFSYPGVGQLIFDSVTARDYPVLQGGFLVLTVGVVTANLVCDLLYARLDPRVRQ